MLLESALLPRGSQLYFPQLRDCPLPAPDLPEGADGEDGELAHPGARYLSRYHHNLITLSNMRPQVFSYRHFTSRTNDFRNVLEGFLCKPNEILMKWKTAVTILRVSQGERSSRKGFKLVL